MRGEKHRRGHGEYGKWIGSWIIVSMRPIPFLFEMTNGSIEKVSPLVGDRSRIRRLKVWPSGRNDATLTLKGTTLSAICTSDGFMLAGGLSDTDVNVD